jgi:putative hemolysin
MLAPFSSIPQGTYLASKQARFSTKTYLSMALLCSPYCTSKGQNLEQVSRPPMSHHFLGNSPNVCNFPQQ